MTRMVTEGFAFADFGEVTGGPSRIRPGATPQRIKHVRCPYCDNPGPDMGTNHMCCPKCGAELWRYGEELMCSVSEDTLLERERQASQAKAPTPDSTTPSEQSTKG